MGNLAKKSIYDLLALHVDTMKELRNRGVLRSGNIPTGDFAEHLFCEAFDWCQERNSKKAYDAINPEGIRFQIKARRLHSRNRSRQLSSIRSIEGFDFLAAVLFDEYYRVTRAAIIPSRVVSELATDDRHVNGKRFLLVDAVWNKSEVEDVTETLREATYNLGYYPASDLVQV